MASVLVVHADDNTPKALLKQADFVGIPLLPVYAGSPEEQGDKDVDLEQVRPETILASPRDWCPHPHSTICLRVRGNSMSPLILDGYIIAVDTADVGHDSLVGKIVVAWSAERGLLVSRLIRLDRTDALVSDLRGYESISLAPEFTWRLVGRVLWWTGNAG